VFAGGHVVGRSSGANCPFGSRPHHVGGQNVFIAFGLTVCVFPVGIGSVDILFSVDVDEKSCCVVTTAVKEIGIISIAVDPGVFLVRIAPVRINKIAQTFSNDIGFACRHSSGQLNVVPCISAILSA